jgi:hypothetical protein
MMQQETTTQNEGTISNGVITKSRGGKKGKNSKGDTLPVYSKE